MILEMIGWDGVEKGNMRDVYCGIEHSDSWLTYIYQFHVAFKNA